MSELPTRPPPVDVETRPFFEAAAEGKLRLPRCEDCDFVIFYPRGRCPACRSRRTRWTDLSGRGTVYSYTIVRRAAGRWKAHIPYVVAYVELEEGPRMITNIIDCDPERVRIGTPVCVQFETAEDGQAIPRFTPA